MKLHWLSWMLIAIHSFAAAQNPSTPPVPLPDAAWKAKIEAAAPVKARVKPKHARKVLLCSLATGFCHDVIPHVKIVMDTLAKTGAFEVTHSNDISMFEPATLAQFDAVIFNNTCTKPPVRNWFIDVLAMDKSVPPAERESKAAALEQSLLDFVAKGKGVVAIHGAIVFLNESQEFSKMMGGSFSMHPKLEELTLKPVEPDHPLLKAFNGKPFVHLDEPYLFHKAYKEKNFRPLLEIDQTSLEPAAQKALQGDRRYVAWIKPHGKGRAFYCSPSHRPETYEQPSMLQFYLDGIQYALGDLACDDAPSAK
jgi:uncharacterized protein